MKELEKILEEAIINFESDEKDTTKELAFRYLTLAHIYTKQYNKEKGVE